MNLKKKESAKEKQVLKQLWNFSGFPETYIKKRPQEHILWRRQRIEKIIREDLRDLSRLPELSQIEMLASLLPDKVGSPLSIESLREDLETSHPTVKRWMNYLESLYYTFSIKPFSQSITRSIKKEPKIYLFDWTEIENPESRFENIIACHLLKSCHYWSDVGYGDFDLCYLRNKQKKEVDFLITKNSRPWLSIECKLSDTNLDTSYLAFQKKWSFPHIQVVYKSTKEKSFENNTLIVSAASFLRCFV